MLFCLRTIVIVRNTNNYAYKFCVRLQYECLRTSANKGAENRAKKPGSLLTVGHEQTIPNLELALVRRLYFHKALIVLGNLGAAR